MTLIGSGAWARAASSLKMTCSVSVAPRPPYSLGHDSPAQPPSYSWRCQSLRTDSSDFGSDGRDSG